MVSGARDTSGTGVVGAAHSAARFVLLPPAEDEPNVTCCNAVRVPTSLPTRLARPVGSCDAGVPRRVLWRIRPFPHGCFCAGSRQLLAGVIVAGLRRPGGIVGDPGPRVIVAGSGPLLHAGIIMPLPYSVVCNDVRVS
jgi:hypothetical protein